MKRIIAAALLFATPLAAQDFSEGSTARSWKLYAEKPALFEAKGYLGNGMSHEEAWEITR